MIGETGVPRRRSAIATLTLTACLASSAYALGGGTLDSEPRYPGVIALRAYNSLLCSAVKIAPHTLLTAAHCVIDGGTGEPRSAFQPGGTIAISNAYRQDGSSTAFVAVVADVRLPEAYAQGLVQFAEYRRRRLAELRVMPSRLSEATLEQGLRMRHHFAERYPDIALVRLQTATARIPSMPIDFEPLLAGAEVELVGFGCSHLRRGGSTAPSAERRWGQSRVIRVDAVNFYTEASQTSTKAPSLCPGDSGGPVVHQGHVVGVHTVVYGLNRQHGARSNMAVNLSPLGEWAAWP
jgi:hypothetical protein